MSSTNLAYAVMGTRVPTKHLFTAGARHPECTIHGIKEGTFCSGCGKRLEKRHKQVPTLEMLKAAEKYEMEVIPLWQMMREKADEPVNPAPLGWWRTHHGSCWTDATNDNDDEVILGLLVAKTPFVGFDDYPVADVTIDRLLNFSSTVEKHLANFGIFELPRLHVFAYC